MQQTTDILKKVKFDKYLEMLNSNDMNKILHIVYPSLFAEILNQEHIHTYTYAKDRELFFVPMLERKKVVLEFNPSWQTTICFKFNSPYNAALFMINELQNFADFIKENFLDQSISNYITLNSERLMKYFKSKNFKVIEKIQGPYDIVYHINPTKKSIYYFE